MSGKTISLLLICWVSALSVFARQDRPVGKFLKDSAKIGEEIYYSLSISYDKNLDVVFPDSLYNFKPFELNKKDYFFTRSDSTTSFDSAVYNLSTFEIDTIQSLALPVWIIHKGDSTPLFSLPDTIVLNQVVTQIPDSLALVDNTIYKEVSYRFNYPYLIIGVSGTIIVVLLIVILFGKQIRQNYILFRLRKSHDKFLKKYQKILEGKFNYESTLLEWKTYMEDLEQLPYTKLTTKEIVKRTNDNLLMKALREIDRAIYSNYRKEGNEKYFSDLVSVSKIAYSEKVKKIKYGTGNN